MVRDNVPAATETTPAPGLLIVTGASHSGKTAVVQAILAELRGEAAFLAVDETLERTFPGSDRDLWQHIPLAYELIRADLGVLLTRGWFVIVESTFTYVPPDGPPEFHREAMERLIEEAGVRGAPAFVVHLLASEETLLSRAHRTGRLDPAIVTGTAAAHAAAALPGSPLAIDTGVADPDAGASTVLELLRTG